MIMMKWSFMFEGPTFLFEGPTFRKCPGVRDTCVCLSVCLCRCVGVCACVCVCQRLRLRLCLCLCMCLCLCLCVCVRALGQQMSSKTASSSGIAGKRRSETRSAGPPLKTFFHLVRFSFPSTCFSPHSAKFVPLYQGSRKRCRRGRLHRRVRGQVLHREGPPRELRKAREGAANYHLFDSLTKLIFAFFVVAAEAARVCISVRGLVSLPTAQRSMYRCLVNLV
jgi:hypothetical protein